MKRKITGIILLMTSLLYTVAGGVFAQEDSVVSVRNRIETGDIDIALKQYNQEGEIFRDGQVWSPGDYIEDIIQIENRAKECWVRVAVECDDKISLKGISEQWIFREPYWYYSEALHEKENILFSEGLMFPTEVTQAESGKTDGVEIIAEAVQAANFTPDFQQDEPWGEQKAELCVHVKDGNESERTRTYQDLLIQMEGAAGQLIAVPDDFFVNLPEMMPGDIQSDEITVNNTFSKEAELFFQTEDMPDMTEEQRELLEQLRFTVYNNNTLIYEGNLRNQELNKEISLGTWKSGEKGKLRYIISMPAELKNEFAVRNAEIRWIFRTNIEEPPKTGDSSWTAAYLILAVISGALGAWILFHREKKE